MSDLQLGLIVIGLLAVAGVLAYNLLQERSARREAERSFGSRHADVLLGAETRREPTFEAPPARAEAGAPEHALPDARLDYVIELAFARRVPAAELAELWQPLEHRFARRALLAGFDGQRWSRLAPAGSLAALRAALQLVTREGVAPESEVIEFRSAIETLAARLGASVAAPEIRKAMEAARELDRVCAATDIQIALHVVGAPVDPDASLAGQPFHVSRRGDGVTLTLDVPRTAEPTRRYEAMVRAGRQLAATANARLVDDNGRDFDERAQAAVAEELESVRKTLAASGIEPGSALALRLFS
jgi:hypothetical protein